MVRTACAVRGMALRMLPPFQEASRASSSIMAWRTSRAISLLALARPWLISRPLCPPFRFLMVTMKAASPSSASLSLYWMDAVMFTPPALPITNSPIVSLSIFRRMSPFSVSGARWFTPYMQVSSSAVMSASSGPCTSSLLSITAMMAATPMPSSDPSVVSLAFSHSPSTHVSMGSVSKLWLLSSVFCGTMSMWACSTAVLWPSIPLVAGLRMTMFSALSLKASMPRSAAQPSRKFCTFSRWPLGRGTCVSR